MSSATTSRCSLLKKKIVPKPQEEAAWKKKMPWDFPSSPVIEA